MTLLRTEGVRGADAFTLSESFRRSRGVGPGRARADEHTGQSRLGAVPLGTDDQLSRSSWATTFTARGTHTSASRAVTGLRRGCSTRRLAGNTDPKKCRPTAGRIEVCAAKYGRNGWLGVARIWLTGDHINQAITKVNDSYFTTATYDTPAWRAMVMCQEIGHDFGLDHQDEAFDNPNLGSCMDYTNDPATNQHPNTHDYDQLEAIYAHLDGTSTVGGTSAAENAGDGSDAANSEWGRLTSSSNGVKKFVLELGHGQRIITVVITADR